MFRLCENYSKYNICNWAIPAQDENPLCRSCRLTHIIPDLTQPDSVQKWYRFEAAKRRLIYTLIDLNLPFRTKSEDFDRGLEFRFIGSDSGPRIMTGHENGVITMNIAEADDVERERARTYLHEPYRTLLGHLRHESGHYYWDRLIKGGSRLEGFRAQFGDERSDYGQSLTTYYRTGPRADWQQNYISAYATVHPWEDWAETWAHYLHIRDALETAQVCGLSLSPTRPREPALQSLNAVSTRTPSFDDVIESWFPVTYVLNSLNRSMGLPDAYPFVISSTAVEKLRFVHETILNANVAESPRQNGYEEEVGGRAIGSIA